jgi:hypothetical protein
MDIDHRLKASDFGILKLLLFGAELYLLFVFCNCLFLVPAPFWGERGLYAAVAAILAAGVALLGGRVSLVGSARNASSSRRILTTLPVVVCIVVLALASLVFAFALLDMLLNKR